ncbi:hypothetical protein BC832DRAFT_567974 [Gaertneriomyces semiglobifer]|nr:hypothetical protein BC832DRAFT_567974 [Gaertneriomyces semiglobifer]
MPGRLEELVSVRFRALCNQCGVSDGVAARWDAIISQRYTEPQRCYHTLQHIHDMLDLLEQSAMSVQDPIALRLAIFFHDVIYDPVSKSNELDSVTTFNQFASDAGLDDELITTVGCYICCTIRHTLSNASELPASLMNDPKLFLDLDLAVLGRPDDGYNRYADEIRREYCHVSEPDYCTGRAAVLKGFLARERLYFTEYFRDTLEARARSNVAKEIQRLEQKAP